VTPDNEAEPIDEFGVYSDDGTGTDLNLARTLATAGPYERFVLIEKSVLDGLGIPWVIDAPYRVCIRSIGENGVSDGNLGTTLVIPRATVPEGIESGDLAVAQV
jgi:hypothetical protein